MKKSFIALTFVAGFLLAILCEPVAAFERIPDEYGFGGFVRLCGGVSWEKSNIIAGNDFGDVGQKKNNSLTAKPDLETDAIPQFDFNLNYTFAGAKTQIFLGSRIEDVLHYDSVLQLGVRKRFTRAGILGAGLLFSATPTEVWKDPYVVDPNRKETDRTSTGILLMWEDIFGSRFDLNYSYSKIELDDENSAESQLIPNGTITSSQANLLDREGDYHAIRAVYTWKFGERHVFTPAMYFLYEDLDGDAMKNITIDFQPTYGYVGT